MAAAENMQGIVPAHDTAPNSLVPLPNDPMEFLDYIKTSSMMIMGQNGNRLMPSIQSAHEAAMVMGYAATLGLNPLSAMQEIHIISGRMAISAEAMRALANRAGVKITTISEDAEHCTIKLARNGDEHTETFSIADAKQAGLIKQGGNWTKWPKQMLRARCTTNGIRWFCPDVLQGVLEINEAQEIAEPTYHPHVVDNEPSSKASPQPTAPADDVIDGEFEPEDEQPAPTLDEDAEARHGLTDALLRNGYPEATHQQWIEFALEVDTPLSQLSKEQCIEAWRRIREYKKQSQQQGTAEEQDAADPLPTPDDYTAEKPPTNTDVIRDLWTHASLTNFQIDLILSDWGGEINADDISASELLCLWHTTWKYLGYAEDGSICWQGAE